ncbi:MAG: hypothetical protein A2066_21690 [Bacteroidetes bacterium GWB2_41_8]|nr:MAG: hypothetical protein A2066_21690 [Bacteroidetes bacterium GWB2_41_8]
MKYAVNQRLFEFLENQEISNVEFQKTIGIKNPQQISNWKKLNEPIPKDHLISTISCYGKLNGHWLLTGEGNMLIEQEKAAKGYQAPVIKLDIAEDGCAMCREKDKRIALMDKHIELLEFSLGKNRRNGSE